MTSCCPPNSHLYLESNYLERGSVSTLGDGTEIYTSGAASGNKGVLIIPDVYGWHGGRVRNICDQFYEAGYFAVVPKLLAPPFEGGVDGDGLVSSFDWSTRGLEFRNWIAGITWEKVIKPRVVAAIKYMKEAGVTKFGVLGFCWGGIMVAHTLAEFGVDGAVVGAIPHPSFNLLAAAYGENAEPLLRSVQQPVLLLPAGNDPDDVKKGGSFIGALQSSNASSETTDADFADMQHGWSVRGDVNDPAIKEKVELAFVKIYAFFAKHI